MLFSLWRLPGTWVITNLWDHFLLVLGASSSSLCWIYHTIIFLEHFHPAWLTLHLFSNCKLSLILSGFHEVLLHPSSGWIITHLSTPAFGSWWSHWVFMAACWAAICDEDDGLTLCEQPSQGYRLMTLLMVMLPSNCCWADSLQSHRYDFSF
jgi:hypothetical protein